MWGSVCFISEENMKSDIVLEEANILEVLRSVLDPDLKKDIVSLGFIKNIKICGGTVSFDLELTTPACPVKENLRNECIEKVRSLPGIESVSVNMTSIVREGRTHVRAGHTQEEPLLSNVKNIVAVASGKGGVGKSSVATNLALSLAKTGAKVGLMDADIYGPSVPTMLGTLEHPMQTPSHKLLPIKKHELKIMSMGLLTTKETPIIWRGPMATKLIQQFLGSVDWGELDYLIIDLPPGTGDIQLTLTQSCPLTGAVIVTTPQDIAINIAIKGVRMFQAVNVPIIGMIENMSYFSCPSCLSKTNIFRHGRTKEICRSLGIPFLGEIPIDPEIVAAGDAGEPVISRSPDSPASKSFIELAGKVAAQISIVNIQTQEATVAPIEIKAVNTQQLSIIWNDGHKSTYEFFTLRYNCPCAECIEEWTGAKKIDASKISKDIYPMEIASVGRYALNFQWSDNHSTGVYTYKLLRSLCSCQSCINNPVNAELPLERKMSK